MNNRPFDIIQKPPRYSVDCPGDKRKEAKQFIY